MSTHNFNHDALGVGICQDSDLPMSSPLDLLVKQAEQVAQLFETPGGFKLIRLPGAPASV